MRQLSITPVLLSLFALAGCGASPMPSYKPITPPKPRLEAQGLLKAAPIGVSPFPAVIKQATVHEAYMILQNNPKAVFIDVRNPDEFAAGHALGTKLYPLPELPTWAPKLDKQAAYVVICRSGSRSMKASTDLVNQGFTNVTNVQGGTNEWEAQGLPMER